MFQASKMSANSLMAAELEEAQKHAETNLSDDFYYKKEDFFQERSAGEVHRLNLSLTYSFGFDSGRRNNLFCLTENIVMFAVGNVLHFLNLKTMEQEFIQGFRKGSIGAIAVHPSRNYIAVGEKGTSGKPLIYIFEYPSLKLFRVLRDGAERSYSCLNFDSTGYKLASVGGDPDHMLTLWDWKREKVILRYKASSQDVFNVQFHPDLQGVLTTSGMGHIKFWKMADTFTGLKLQGTIGKFGVTELTDIAAFIQLPDGKVISGTETGNLLLWDGGIVKCEISLKGRGCHNGPIEVMVTQEDEILTAGDDGVIRIWDFETIDNVELNSSGGGGDNNAQANVTKNETQRVFEIEPVDEIFVGKDVKIKALTRCVSTNPEYLLQDSSGCIWRLDMKKRSAEKVYHYHSGPISAVDASPSSNRMISLGCDGALRLYDYNSHICVGRTKFSAGGTALAYLPESLDPTGTFVVCGFSDGVVRIIKHTIAPDAAVNPNKTASFYLTHISKPHSKAVMLLSISNNGKFLSTASEDGTIFFFLIKRAEAEPKTEGEEFAAAATVETARPKTATTAAEFSLQPLGFVKLSGSITSMSWIPDSFTFSNDPFAPKKDKVSENERKRLLVSLSDGSVQLVLSPDITQVNNETTFLLPDSSIEVQKYHFDIKDDIMRAELEGESAFNVLLTQAQEEEAMESFTLKPGCWAVHFDKETPLGAAYNVFSTLPVDNDHFLLSGQSETGSYEVRLCSFSHKNSSRLLYHGQSQITFMRLTNSKRYLLFGSADGSVFLRPFSMADLRIEKDLGCHQFLIKPRVSLPSNSGRPLRSPELDVGYWVGHMHDVDRGVLSVSLSSDDSHCFSSGIDGGLYVWRVNSEEVKPTKASQGNIADYEAPQKTVDDITEGSFHSIQEAKLKQQSDKEFQSAESKKQQMRNLVHQLRNEFTTLLKKWKDSHYYNNEERNGIQLDPGLFEEIEKLTQQRIEDVHKQMAWSTEKAVKSVEKYKQRFLDDILTERIEISSFKSGDSVATFRTVKISDEEIPSNVNTPQKETADTKGHDHIAQITDFEGEQRHAETRTKTTKQVIDNKSKQEARKEIRAARAAMLQELLDSKPDETYEDPQDIAAIHYAEKHMGDFKLKTSPKYSVPQKDRMNAIKKSKQILVLKESMLALKEQFNSMVLQSLSKKEELVVRIKEYNSKLSEINEELVELGESVDKTVWIPSLDARAHPEERYNVTEGDIKEYQQREAERARQAKAADDDPLGGFNAGKNNQAPAVVNPVAIAKRSSEEELADISGLVTNVQSASTTEVLTQSAQRTFRAETALKHPGIHRLAGYKVIAGIQIELSALEKQELDMRVAVLKFRKARIMKTVDEEIKTFDASIRALARERLLLEGDMKFADMKLLVLYKEWVLLKECEKQDNELMTKLALKQTERNELNAKIRDCQAKITEKKNDVEEVIRREKEIQQELKTLIGDDNKYEDFLLKLFRQKVKRSKKKHRMTENGEEIIEDDDESEYSLDELSDIDSDDLSSNEEQFDDTRPADCDKVLYDKVLAAREARMDQEELLVEIQKFIDVLKKEYDALQKKLKTAESAVALAEEEIETFQTAKQKKFNDLDIFVPLRLHQLQYLENNALPKNLSAALVFSNNGLHKLRDRIQDLHQEKTEIKKQHKELKKMHVHLLKDRKEKQAKLQEQETKAVDVQMLKFGRLVDLDKLEKMSSSKVAEELRDKIAKDELRREKELRNQDIQLTKLKEEYNRSIAENTRYLERMVELTEMKQKLENELNVNQTTVTTEYSGPLKTNDPERQQLKELVERQRQEIEILQREIYFLTHKTAKPFILNPKTRTEKPVHPTMQQQVEPVPVPNVPVEIVIADNGLKADFTVSETQQLKSSDVLEPKSMLDNSSSALGSVEPII